MVLDDVVLPALVFATSRRIGGAAGRFDRYYDPGSRTRSDARGARGDACRWQRPTGDNCQSTSG